MKIRHDLEQGTYDWLAARCGLLTASEAKNLLTPRFEIRKGEMVETLLARKLAEKWNGPIEDKATWAMEQGTLIEQEAFDEVQKECKEPLTRVGFIESDDGRCGCSPDGLIGVPDADGCRGLELKGPQPVTHVKWLLAGGLPEEHAVQVHFSLWLTNFTEWLFVSYRKGFPALSVPVAYDRAICAKISIAVHGFNERFDREWTRLVALNGGEPRDWRRSPEKRAEIDAAWDRAGRVEENSMWPRAAQ